MVRIPSHSWRLPGCRLTEQLAADCQLLEALRVMDYSLLLGVHYRGGPHATPVNTDRVCSPAAPLPITYRVKAPRTA